MSRCCRGVISVRVASTLAGGREFCRCGALGGVILVSGREFCRRGAHGGVRLASAVVAQQDWLAAVNFADVALLVTRP